MSETVLNILEVRVNVVASTLVTLTESFSSDSVLSDKVLTAHSLKESAVDQDIFILFHLDGKTNETGLPLPNPFSSVRATVFSSRHVLIVILLQP